MKERYVFLEDTLDLLDRMEDSPGFCFYGKQMDETLCGKDPTNPFSYDSRPNSYTLGCVSNRYLSEFNISRARSFMGRVEN